ncbi:MAG: DNA translocase FtsK 4TM domain-containing protein [Spirosomataceae bacterium]
MSKFDRNRPRQTASPPPPPPIDPKSKPKKKEGKQMSFDFGNADLDGFKLFLGVFSIIIAAGLLIAFVSYIFTGDADQDLVQMGWKDAMAEVKRTGKGFQNWIGAIGAYTSHYFIFLWLGFAALGLLPMVFLAGVKIAFKRDLIPYNLNRFIVSSIFYIFWTSIFLGCFIITFGIDYDKICGGIGMAIGEQLHHIIGGLSIIFMLLILFGWLIFFHGLTKIDDYVFLHFGKSKTKDIDEDFSTERIRNAINDIEVETEVKPSKKVEEEKIDFLKIKEEEPVIAEPEKPKVQEVTFEVNVPNEKIITANEPFKGGVPFVVENAQSPEPEPIPELIIEKVEPKLEVTDLDDDDVNEKVLKDFGLFDPTLDLPEYQYPTLDLMNEYSNAGKVTDEELEQNKNKIVESLRNFQIGISSIKATIGPTVTLYEIVPEAGIRISKIKNLEDDIALSLAALGIRIIAPMPGKGTIGIEVPNKNREMVSMKSVLSSEKFQKTTFDLPVILGKTISNDIFISDLAKMPHLLMAGATGQGKSVGLNVILASLLYKKHPAQIKFVLVDPKKVELTLFTKIERHFLAMLPNAEEAIITDTKKVIYTLNSLCIEMDNRYNLLKDAGVRNIKEYNTKFINRRLNPEKGHRYLPYIVLVIDELADLMMTAGKEVEQPIARLAQLARAIGIHLIIATQRPSVNVITGLIKANFPARLSFKVTSKIDSRTILDTGGSEQLVGNGDMLLSMGSDMIRLQCPFVDTPEIDGICEFIGSQRAYESAYLLPEFYGDDEQEPLEFDSSDLDEYFEEAARLLVAHQQGSTSLIQRKMKLGYNRAGRIIDQLEAAGIVGPFEGSKAREVLIKDLVHLEEVLREIKGK